MNYHLGFSFKGFMVFLLPMIPNIFYFLIPTSGASRSNINSHIVLDVLEHGSQALFFFMIIFVIRKQIYKNICPYTVGMAIMLLFYYVFWIFCFTGESNIIILLAMAVLPVIYFILAEIWLNNYLSIIPTALFGIIHVIITYLDFS
ncbi:hypothetical protein [Sporolactobacillus sp. KGMB 08714]|uniref:hypothetical protein n=1 Tax=Sporolactobacillus sp. KGMB 08714 TaxID=3064704 RepID=UPI002FBF1716